MQQDTELTQETPKTRGRRKIIEISKGWSIFSYFLGAMVIFGCCFVSYLFVFNVLFMQVSIKGTSMQPIINATGDGDRVFCYRTHEADYSDIVVINGGYTLSGEDIIKRVIAKPSDTITLKKVGEFHYQTIPYYKVDVYVNGNKINEDYVKDGDQTVNATENLNYMFANQVLHAIQGSGEFSLKLGDDEYFVMGDNRKVSLDSRVFGPIKKEDVIGKVVILVKDGQTLFNAIWSMIF